MAADGAARPYRGPIQAVILDWAGTIVDYGSRAPAGVFVELFARHGIPITIDQARGPMGAHKRDHIAELLKLPDIASRWHHEHEGPGDVPDIDLLYVELIPLQLAALPQYADLVPGTLEAVTAFRARGCKIGTTTGYNREMLEVLLAEAHKRGFEPDCSISADEVPVARPAPFMALRNMIDLGVFPAEACAKVGDTVPDILEALNAGMWAIAVTKTGNELGLSEEEVVALPRSDLKSRLDRARERLSAAGSHYVVESIADVPPLLDDIESRLARGERP